MKRMMVFPFVCGLALVVIVGVGSQNVLLAKEEIVRLQEGLGKHHFRISTHVPMAQRYFDQGMILMYGFNHAEAARSFRYAQKLDPACGMCFWGEGLVLGPNINAPMEDRLYLKPLLRCNVFWYCEKTRLGKNVCSFRLWRSAMLKRYQQIDRFLIS